MPICLNCGNTFPIKIKINNEWKGLQNRKYCLECSPYGNHNTRHPDYIRTGKSKVRLQNSQYVNKSRTKRKRQFVTYLGGKCVICGYNRCINALEFHHKNPKEKAFTISSTNRSFENTKQELDKCILVCSNCHRELEAGIIEFVV